MTSNRTEAPGRGGYIALSLIVIILMAFSDDLVEGLRGEPQPWSVLLVDVVLLTVGGLLIWFGQASGSPRRIMLRQAATCFAVGVALTLLLDLYLARTDLSHEYLLWSTAAYYLAFVLIMLPALGVTPTHLRTENKPSLDRFLLGLPLLTGTLGAYVASLTWRWNGPNIDQQYFAQVSQIIPVLFVAIGIEGRYFRRDRRKRSVPGLTALLLGLLVLGEVMALSALVPSVKVGPTPWHQYLGLVITAFACIAALTTLVLTILGQIDPDQSLSGGGIGGNSEEPTGASAEAQSGATSARAPRAHRKPKHEGGERPGATRPKK